MRRGSILPGIAVCLLILGASSRLYAASLVWVSDDTYSIIWGYDASSGSFVRGLSAPQAPLRSTIPRPKSGLAAANGNLYYTHTGSERIWVVDPLTALLVTSFEKPAADISGLAAGDGALFAVSGIRRDGVLYRLNPATGTVLDTVRVGAARETPGTYRAINVTHVVVQQHVGSSR